MMGETVNATAMSPRQRHGPWWWRPTTQIDDALEGMTTLLEASRDPILKAKASRAT